MAFVRQSVITEEATIQIWMPSHLVGKPDPEVQLRERRISPGSHLHTTPSNTDHGSRQNSIASSRSGAATSSTSRDSVGQEHISIVRTDDRGSSMARGMIRSPPRNPLLVFFTLDNTDPQAPKRSFVAVKIDDKTRPNPSSCNCDRSNECKITALVQQSNGFVANASRPTVGE